MAAAKCIAVRLVAGLVFAFSAAHALAAEVLVFGAASLREALDEQARIFANASGNKVTVSYAASSALARQIVNGAPADLFISADLEWMDYVDERRLLRPGTRVELLRNALVLIAPAATPARLRIGPGFSLAVALGQGRLAMADPDSVPAGKYGRAALEHLGVWSSVERRIARAENVRAALALVSRGEAPFGIVYATDAQADKGVRVVGSFPADSHRAIVYPAAIVATSSSAAAKPLLDYLQSAAARPVWERYGFRVTR